jgi:glycerol-3-phosphate dehydrogenase
MNRSVSLQKIKSATEPFDILIIGGGATGLGAAVDAASRGHRVALIEQYDFAKGTSSKSTKLVHGGVRYLRQGNISLVLEALRERGRLTRNAPHLVHDLAFVIPNYSWWEGPFYGVGMKVYDQLAGKLGLSPSKILSKKETLNLIPTVETENLVGGVVYHDGQFDDSRLAINLAQTAENHGGVLVNYCEAKDIIKENGSISGVEVCDTETGSEFIIKAKCVINATGVFVDKIRLWDDASAQTLVTVSQGIHIILPKKFLPGNAAIMVPKTADGRVLFAVPWHNHVVVGTTDTPLGQSTIEPRALNSERDFIMEHAKKYLSSDPSDSDILSVFAGLRPLVKSTSTEGTAALSRDHTIVVSESGLITITGGKWTTYRKMAEDVVDQAEMIAGIDNIRCKTEDLLIHGHQTEAPPSGRFAIYGKDSEKIEALIKADASLSTPIHPLMPYYLKAEVLWAVRSEMARTVEDVLARRTRALLLNAKASIEAAPVIAEIIGNELDKNLIWRQSQIIHFTEQAKGYIW